MAESNVNQGIYKTTPPEGSSAQGEEMVRAELEKPGMTDFKPYLGKKRKPGTGYIGQKGPNLWEGRYSPIWIGGKKHARNVYRPHPRGIRGEAEGTDRGDESGTEGKEGKR